MIWILESIKEHFEWDWTQLGVVIVAACTIASIFVIIVLLYFLWQVQWWKWLVS